MRTTIAISLILAVLGCQREENKPSERSRAAEPAKPVPVEPVAADNTKKNERDRGTNTLTPGDQGESEADRTITQQVRQEVVSDDALSMTAKNVKIITVEGVVTLRGPVKTEKEKTNIGALARKTAGVKRVDNQLEIEKN
jgi:hyperosmotically inducible periplasmic protein